MDMTDIAAKARRELMRWQLLVVLHLQSPEGANVDFLKPVIRATYGDVTDIEIKRNLDYLHERELVHLSTDPLGQLAAKLARYGFDVVEYTVDCDAGVFRPRKTGGL